MKKKESVRFGLVDCNNFYASCERVFRPDWATKPIGVLSNNDGCIIARSKELKELGIAMGSPYYQCAEKLKSSGAVVVSSNYALYGDFSARVMDILASHALDFEVYSIDEGWLTLPVREERKAIAHGEGIVADVARCTGIPVSVGIGLTKTLAKVANRIAKKEGKRQVYILEDFDKIERDLACLAIGEVWGIGKRLAYRMKSQGIFTALDLQQSDPSKIRKRYGVVVERLLYELRGEPCLGIEEVEPSKQILSSRSFHKSLGAEEDLLEALSFHVTKASEKMRKQQLLCRSVGIFLKVGSFNAHQPRATPTSFIELPNATADTRVLIRQVLPMLQRIYCKGMLYHKAGVILSDFITQENYTEDWFAPALTEDSCSLMQALDSVNRKYGRSTLFFGSEGTSRAWAMKRERLTPAYTTRWEQLRRVK